MRALRLHSFSSGSVPASACSWCPLGLFCSVPARTVKYVAYISGQTSDTFAVYCRRGAYQNLTHPPTLTHIQSFLCHLLAPHVRRSDRDWVSLETSQFAVRSSQLAYFIIHFPSLFHYYFHFHILFYLLNWQQLCVCPTVVSLTNCFKLHFHNVFLCVGWNTIFTQSLKRINNIISEENYSVETLKLCWQKRKVY